MAIDINVPSQVKTYANLAAFPATGSLKTIFIAEDTNKTYRWTGSVYVEVSAAGATGITIGTTAITSGTVGRVLFEGTGNVVQESANLFWNNTNGRLGIGTSSPIVPLDVVGTMRASTVLTTEIQASSDITVRVANGVTTVMQYKNATGNVLINTTTDAGYKLDVNGTARVQNTLTVTKSGSTNYFNFEPSATGTAPYLQGVFQGSVDARIYFDSSAFKFRAAGSTSPFAIDCAAITSNGNIFVGGGKIELASSTNNFLQFTDLGAINIGVIGTADATSYIQVRTGNATNMSTGTLSTTFFNSGNVGIGGTTTDAGYKLDVNGTARVQSETTIGTSAHPFSTNLITLISNAGSNAIRIGGGGRLDIAGSMNAATIQSTDFVQAVRFLVGNGLARLTATTTNWLGITDSSQSSNGSGNISANAGTFGTAYATINASAQVEIASTTKGFLCPRMTTTQINAIASPAEGLQVYNTTINHMCFYQSGSWVRINHSPM